MRMKSVVSLLVLLHCCLSGAQVHKDRDGQTCQPDIHTVLREMSTMMAEQRVELRHTKTELGAMEARLRASESRLTASESLVEELKVQLKSKVEELSKMNEGHTGPFNTGITLVYRNIYSNIGNAYNPTTGIFTAPVRGLYLFRFYIYGWGESSVATSAVLHKNGHHIAIAHADHSSGGINSSNGVSLLLEVGDVIYMHLWAGRKIYDNESHHSTFSGHLLFTM
uniref:C1q domain-containing protein n=1 Tax=Salmo trutta TaxID=8032 RepID=A0A674BKD3_SALTR